MRSMRNQIFILNNLVGFLAHSSTIKIKTSIPLIQDELHIVSHLEGGKQWIRLRVKRKKIIATITFMTAEGFLFSALNQWIGVNKAYSQELVFSLTAKKTTTSPLLRKAQSLIHHCCTVMSPCLTQPTTGGLQTGVGRSSQALYFEEHSNTEAEIWQ